MGGDLWLRFSCIGASACVELRKYDDAVQWCDDGLVVSLLCKVLVPVRRSCDVHSKKKILTYMNSFFYPLKLFRISIS